MSGKNLKNNKHHVEPKSRITKKGKNCKKVKVPVNFHSSWNMIFDNLYGEELVVFIKRMNFLMETEREITWKDINKIRIETKDLNLNGDQRANKLSIFFKSILSERIKVYQHEQS